MIPWEKLTDAQRAGMDREYWESLTRQEQQALVDIQCIEPDCTNPRWLAAGSFRCEGHTRKFSTQTLAARTKPEHN